MQSLVSLSRQHPNLRATSGHRRRRRLPHGFTLLELTVVLIIAGMVMAIAFPKTKDMRDRNSVRAAKQQFNSYLSTARAAAIRQSLQGQFYINGNAISATVTQSDGTRLTIGRSASLSTARGVTVTLSGATANDSIIYDPRGFETIPGAARTYVFTKNNATDSVCVSKMGLIARFCGQ